MNRAGIQGGAIHWEDIEPVFNRSMT